MRNACVSGLWIGEIRGLLGQGAGVTELLSVAVALGHGQRLDDDERVELVGSGVAQLARVLDRLQALHLAVEVPGKVGALHLAVGDDVDARLFHVQDGEPDRVLQRLVDVIRAHLAARDRVADDPHPARARRMNR